MKNIEITYEALICENGIREQGEAAFVLPMSDELPPNIWRAKQIAARSVWWKMHWK